MAVSLLLFCILYLQIITTQQTIILLCLPVVCYYNSGENMKEKKTRMGMFLSPRMFSLVCFSCNLLQFGCLFSNLCDITLIHLLLGFFSGVQEALSRVNFRPKQMPKLLSKFVFFSFHLTWLLLLSLSLPFSPSLSPFLFVLIITKPCHHGSCGHVNQPGQHHLFPAVYLQPNKGVCLFVVAGVECCVGWGLLFNSARCYQPPSLKRPIQHRESME